MVQVMGFVLALLLILGNPFKTYASKISQILNQIQRFYESINSLEADFIQKTYFFNGKVKVYEGKLWLKKPGKFRWEYLKPERFLIVSSGKFIYIYYPEEKQAFVYKTTRAISSQMVIGFMNGKGNIKKDLKLDSFKVIKRHWWMISFVPAHPDPQIEKIILIADLKTGEVKRFFVINSAGQKVEVTFKNVKYNVKIRDSLFTIHLPKDAELINSF
ncbi:MAG: outer membrane lipoprotein carrier protein LolA [Thermodesulfobacteria bacterium]|nr:outer membrane lipoprotein carrier protein LolA [Thermodesulfobacteriota bacterium]